jgi:nitrogen regulation protein NR(I)
MGRILLADDDPGVLSSVEMLLAEQGHSVVTARSGQEALRKLRTDPPDAVLMDVRMPGMSGLDAFRRIKETDPRLPVIIMTAFATAETAIEATELGAFEYHLKPFEPEDLLRSLSNALESARLMQRPVTLASDGAQPGGDAMVGRSEPMQRVYKAIGRVAKTNATVLIHGETGTGKEFVARAVYQHSQRAGEPMIVVNCVAIPETLLESELFGHEKGSFTGASARRIGRFEQADGGTMFLDEIGDMPLGTQAKLLRVLQERSFERIGGDETIDVDVRVIAATNRNLEGAIGEGRFREDLYHRLNVFAIEVPPLRERREDIPRLAAYFLARFSADSGVETPGLSEETMAELMAHDWPGNVRELEHCVHRAMIHTSGYPIQPADVRRALESSKNTPLPGADSSDADRLREIARRHLKNGPGGAKYAQFLDLTEKTLLSEALRLTGGNQTHAAKLLGITRPTLKAKMDRRGLTRETTIRE